MKKIALALIILLAAVKVWAQPNITAVYVQSSTASTATIVWTTNIPATSQVNYWTAGALYPSSTPTIYTLVTSHSMTLTNLNDVQPYSFNVQSADSFGRPSTSNTYQFALCGVGPTPIQGTVNKFYGYGTWSMTWNPPSGAVGSPTVCGVPLVTTVSGNLDQYGALTAVVGDSLKVTPGPGSWTVHADDLGNLAPISITQPLSAVTTEISGPLQAAALAAGLTGCLANTLSNQSWPPSCASSAGGGPTIETNGTRNISQSLLNFVNPASFNGLSFAFSNPSGGIETFGVTGTLNNSGLTNSSTTVNGQTCTLGGSCTISTGGATLQTNSVNNSSQSLLNFVNTASVLFTNPSGGVESATVPTATSSSLGIVEPDNVTITISAGVLTAITGGCGSVSGDVTSTNCGTGNQVGNTGTHVSTFGYTNVLHNTQTDVTAIGTDNLNQNFGTEVFAGGSQNFTDTVNTNHASSNTLLALGWFNGQHDNGVATSNEGGLTYVGEGNGTDITGNGPSQIVGIGGFNVQDLANGSSELFGGGDSTLAFSPGANTTLNEMVALGDNDCSWSSGTQPTGQRGDDWVCIGDGSGLTIHPGSSDVLLAGDGAGAQDDTVVTVTPVSDVVCLGDAPCKYNQGNDIVAVGHQALSGQAVGAGAGIYNRGNENTVVASDYGLVGNTTGTQNVAIGGYAGSDGYVPSPGTNFGNSNHTGSQDTWVGYDSGPGVTSQLSNASAFGYGAHNDASNQIVLGNGSVTQFRVPAVKSSSGLDCLQADTTGNITNTGSGCVTYNPSNTALVFAGASSNGDDQGNTLGPTFTVSSWSCTGTTCSVVNTGTNGFVAGDWVYMRNVTGWPNSTNLTTGYTLFQVLSTGLSSTTFTFNAPLVASGSGSGGTVEAANGFLPFVTSREPFFKGHSVVSMLGTTAQSLNTNFGTYVGVAPTSPAYLYLSALFTNDIGASCRSAAQIEADLQGVWSQAHTDGWTVIQGFDNPIQWNTSNSACTTAFTTWRTVYQWIVGQGQNTFNSSPYCTSTCGQYWDRSVDMASLMRDQGNTNLFNNTNLGVYSSGGVRRVADYINAAMSVQGSMTGSFPYFLTPAQFASGSLYSSTFGLAFAPTQDSHQAFNFYNAALTTDFLNIDTLNNYIQIPYLTPVSLSCLTIAASTGALGTTACGGTGLSGTVTYTSSQTASTSDNAKLVIMNCSSACAYTLPGTQPSSTWAAAVVSMGSTVATIALGGGDTWNGASAVPVLNSYRFVWVFANTATSTDYRGDAPLVAGTNVTLTAATNGLTVASSGGGGSGTVNSGTQGQLAYYASAGTAVSGAGPGTAKQITVSGGTSGPSFVDFPMTLVIPAANCNNATAGAGWSLPTSAAPTAACRTGTNVQAGVLQFAASNTAQFQVDLPNDWDSSGTVYAKIMFTQAANTTSGQTIIMQIATACASTTDDPSFNTAQAFGTATTVSTANTAYTETLSSVTMTGCSAGQSMNLKVSRSGSDTATTAPNVYWVSLTIPRLITNQAN